MTEFIAYTKDVFFGQKNVIADDNIKLKYEALFHSADCFFSNGFTSKKFTPKTDFRKPPTNYVSKKPFCKLIKKTINPLDKNYIKKAKCILNVINASNYAKQYNKMKFIVEEDNVNEIVPLILDVSIMQIFYVKLFVDLLLDLCKDYKIIITEHIDIFVDKFIADGLVLPEEESTDYDKFCAFQKCKQTKLSCGIMILHLINAGLSQQDIKKYIETIIEQCEEKKDENIVDVVLQIILEYKKMKGPASIFFGREKFAFLSPTTKARFMIDDIFA